MEDELQVKSVVRIKENAPEGATHYFIGEKYAVCPGYAEHINSRYKACQLPCKGDRVILSAYDIVGAEPLSSDIKPIYPWASIIAITNPTRILYFSIDTLSEKQGSFEKGRWFFFEDWLNLELLQPL